MENSQKRKCEALDAKKYKNTYQAPLGYGSEDDKGNEEGKGQVTTGAGMDSEIPGDLYLTHRSQVLVTQVWVPVLAGPNRCRIAIEHHTVHVLYCDVSVPVEVLDIVCKNLDNATPNKLVGQIQALFPQVTANQIHTAWTVMSEELWKQDNQQLTSAKLLMEDLSDDIEIFDVVLEDGVEQICWGMKQIAWPLIGKVVEVGLDATCELMDSGENEGGRVDSDMATMEMEEQKNPNAVYLQITKAQKESATMTRPPNMKVATLTIKLPSWVLPKMATASENANEDHSCCIFCPDDLQVQLVDMVELYFCVHPLIPGYAAPSAPGICCWAVKQMVDFCVANDLHEAWAYLCENWY
ncbi:SWIM-type domain-containing protein [Salix suchowensis]|nr:SWIM-type domain-containing protein [Salix suchowensis]